MLHAGVRLRRVPRSPPARPSYKAVLEITTQAKDGGRSPPMPPPPPNLIFSRLQTKNISVLEPPRVLYGSSSTRASDNPLGSHSGGPLNLRGTLCLFHAHFS